MNKHNMRKLNTGSWTSRAKPCSRCMERATLDAAAIYEDLLPDLKHGSNGFAWACCPFHDDNNPSLCVNVESGWYKCHSSNCGATGSNIVGFVGELLGYEYREAREYLEQHYG
jgi:DNA primase